MNKWFAVVSFAALAGCGGDGARIPVGFTDITLTQFRPFEAGGYVLRARDELAAAWDAAPFRVFPIGIVMEEPAFPNYDFGTSMVVGVSLGIGKWCFKPHITEVLADGADLVVRYDVRSTGTLACMLDGPMISFALVPKADGAVGFERRDL